MQLKLGDIINFNVFYDTVKTQKLSFKTLYKLSTLAKSLDEKIVFYQEQLNNILRDCGELDADGNLIPTANGQGVKLKSGMQDQCINRLNELQNVEVEMPDISFSVEEFGDIELTLDVFNIISPFMN